MHTMPAATPQRPTPAHRRVAAAPATLAGIVAAAGLSMAAAAAGAAPLLDPNGGGPSACGLDSTLRLAATPAQVVYGQPTTLSWALNSTETCKDLHLVLDGVAVPRSGSRSEVLARSTGHTLQLVRAQLGGSSIVQTATTKVKVTYPYRLVLDATSPKPVEALVGALDDSNTNPEQIVELCNVNLDMTGYANIGIGERRSLIASPHCARGARAYGPRIYVTDKRSAARPLFQIRADNVLVSGFRLEGPTGDIGTDDDNNMEVGIQVWPYAGTAPMRNIVVSNMEISRWSGSAVSIGDNAEATVRGRLSNQNVGAVRVSGSYIHHNQHAGTNGYGVAVTGGAYALIERNVFAFNRHAIAGRSGNGRGDWSGYTASDNLVLPGGGVHCDWATCWQTHQIDMHGDQGSTPLRNDYCCGTAGETIVINRNTILYTGGYLTLSAPLVSTQLWFSGNAIKIHGNPVDKAVVDNNVFAHATRADAIVQNGDPGPLGGITRPIDVRANNVFGANPVATLGSCDFAGDGQQDAFMATGVTWWARSPVTGQWRYLNTQPEKLPQLALLDANGDGKCDVVRRSAQAGVAVQVPYSAGGTGPWTGPVAVVGF